MSVRLLSVDDVQVTLNKSDPPTLLVMVSGRAATPGYTNVALNILEGDLSPDRIFDLELVGDPPEGIVPQVVVPVHANLVIAENVDKIAGVIVHARTNSRTALLNVEAGQVSLNTTLPDFLERIGPAFPRLPPGRFTTLALGEEGWPTLADIFTEGTGPFALEKDIRNELLRKSPGFEDFDPRERLVQRGPFGER
ncbi:hypothetical protein MRS76_18105 [Rhizobiaceae bacterium n13]|uniref:Uncharacterized protein n=1 Tax=Ferirhizobium litorale TaxID=2927786 RepID=A0AAE3U5Q4_9HYPH|nr:hypothetical protein [Fererhizobium litorale]MDI7863869.1 hypothetical protein [Fererhizobium litorale]MDI7924299.1 hypothetical protein [Fererhizobium litorale]